MAEVFHGNANANRLNARADKSQVYGLKGNDTLTSSDKRDVLLVGGSGDDSLIISGGNGTLSGGDGSDTFELTYSATKPLSAVIEDFVPASDKIVVNFDGNTAPQLNATTSGNDVVLSDGNLLNVTLKSVRDNDYFDGDASEQAWKVLELTNAEREAQGLPALTMADGLTAGAEIRVEEITSLGTAMHDYEHTRPDNKGYYDTVLDGKYNFPGENLDGGDRSPAQVVREWMNSQEHKENILRDRFQKIGVAYNEFDEDPSDLRFYWVQLFADSLKAQSVVDVSSASPQLNAVSKFIQGDDEPNTLTNAEYGVTIDARGGGDSVTNTGLIVSIGGGDDNDTINNSGNFATINGGHGNDRISLNAAQEVVIQYASGDGSDTVSGLNATDTVTISGDEFTPAQVGDDIIVTVGSDSITLLDAAKDGVQLLGARSKLIILTDGNDSLDNTEDGATIQAKGGNDVITNYYGDNVSIDGGAGNDSLDNDGDNVTINGGTNDDYIFNSGKNVSVLGGAGTDSLYNTSLGAGVTLDGGDNNDTVSNYSESVTIDGGLGNDYLQNQAANVSIFGNSGADVIHNVASDVTITAGEGNDSVANTASNVTIDGGEYNDTIDNLDGANVSIVGGIGNDSLSNDIGGTNVTIDGGADEDFIINAAANVTINAGANTDRISLGATAQNNLLIYNAGDGSDVIDGLNETSTLRIGDGTGTYATQQSGDNLIVQVSDATITLRGAANVLFTIEGTEGQGSDTTPVTDKMIMAPGGGELYRSYVDNATINAVDGDIYYISNYGTNVFVSGASGNDTLANRGNTVIIKGNDGDDFLSNQGTNVGVDGGDGNDYIENIGPRTRIDAGNDKDTIYNGSASVTVGGGAGNDSVYNEGINSGIVGGADDDTITNRAENVTIFGGDGNDYINNDSNNVFISGGTGDDLISLASGAQNVLIFYNAGDGVDVIAGFGNDDTLSVLGDYTRETVGNDVRVYVGTGVVVLYGAASLTSVNITDREEGTPVETPLNVHNTASNTLITGTAYGDTISNTGERVTIQALGGNDSIVNYTSSEFETISSVLGGTDGDNASIDTGAGDDTVRNTALNVTITTGAGNDFAYNEGSGAVISGGEDKDTLRNVADGVSILGGAGNDDITDSGANATINGGAGDDNISLSGDGAGSYIRYTAGEGNDTIWGLSSNSTLRLDGTDTYSTQASGDDVIIHVGANTITLKNYRDDPKHIIIGASGTSGGGSDSGNDSGNDSSSGRGGIGDGSGVSSGIGGNTSGGTSGSEGRGSAASGGRSASGSSGRSASTGSSGGNTFRRHTHSTTTDAPTVTTSTETINQLATTSTTSTETQQTSTATQRVYTGSNQVIADYTSGERIIFGAQYTGAFFDGAGNFFAGSTTGALVVQNATDKVIDLGDAAGNSFVKAYSATTAGIIDGRGLGGFELINGSAGADAIYAGDGGSQLWGGADTVSDAMLGGNGTDIFIGGKNQGADFFLNASAADIVHLNDATLSDIVATAEENGTIGIAFNTGNVVAVQSSEAISATVMLADGSAYRFNHANKSWQTA